MDIAKSIFHLHIVDPETGEISRLKLRRNKVIEFFANTPKALVGMEACGGAHYWARVIQNLGHEALLLPANHVKAFVVRDKTDANDARAIWVAAQQSHIKSVPVKSKLQQGCLALHRMRAQLMKMRIMQTNALRGLLYEFGVILPEGHRALLKTINDELAATQEKQLVPEALIISIQEQLKRIDTIQSDIDQIDKRLAQIVKSDAQMTTLQTVPGIGVLSATALVATATDINAFVSGRQFAAWLGLTPRQTGTGGKTRQLGISKRGDPYVRTMLMHGARAIIARSNRSSWIEQLLERRPYSVVVAALANKLARIAWAVLVKGNSFDPKKWGCPV